MTIHDDVINAIKQEGGETFSAFDGLSRREIIRMLFQNYRHGEQRGLRLTKTGYEIMSRYFSPFVVPRPEAESYAVARHLLFLDRVSTQPYYCGHNLIALYDRDLGIQLRLVDGNIDQLISKMRVRRCWNI